jgi:5-(carboxyamino)imidazole ribonucleotide synthase
MELAGGRPPRVGIVGAGQLARMMAQAAVALGIELRILATRFDESAARIWPDVVIGSPDNAKAMERLAAGCDVTTFDHELVDTVAVATLEASGLQFAPDSATMTVAQSKRLQRERFSALGLPVPAYEIVEAGSESLQGRVENFSRTHGWPVMVKADRGGYDGRGVWMVRERSEVGPVAAIIAEMGVAAVMEAWVPIDSEAAIQIARTAQGQTATYPVVETVQVNGMLDELHAPAELPLALEEEAAATAKAIADDLDVVGLLAVELFVSEGRLLVNEIATRPHNSGHHTIEGAVTSQFEQHLRAILGLPLGSPALRGPYVTTVNATGQPGGGPLEGHLERALVVEGAHIHIYGKSHRESRKLGHVTVVADDRQAALDRARRAARLLEGRRENDIGAA